MMIVEPLDRTTADYPPIAHDRPETHRRTAESVEVQCVLAAGRCHCLHLLNVLLKEAGDLRPAEVVEEDLRLAQIDGS